MNLEEVIEKIGRHFALQELELNKWQAQRFGEPENISAYGSTPLEASLNLLEKING